ncbi:MAG: glycosyltransferase family 39 protein [Chloroflexi bacterium]|nr:glycosyltransferase family 39 protein [Chloroflexota bacterium]
MPRKKAEPTPPPEPSVLDYLKALVRREAPPAIPAEPEPPAPRRKAAAEEVVAVPKPRGRKAAAVQTVAAQPEAVAAELEQEPSGPFPWLGLAAIGLGLAAQAAFNQEPRSGMPGALFLAVAVGLAVWAYFRKAWRLAEPAETAPETPPDPLTVRTIPLILAAVLSGLAFWALGVNQFTPENVALWALGLAFAVWAFWLRDPNAPRRWWPKREPGTPLSRNEIFAYLLLGTAALIFLSALAALDTLGAALRQAALGVLFTLLAFRLHEPAWWRRARAFLARPYWGVHITRFGLLLALAFLTAAFFRFYRLDSVPADMFSDQAEKLLDVMDVLNGQTRIFFPRNTGREPLQFYLIAATVRVFKTGVSFLSMKIGTAGLGFLSLIYVYLLGKEVGGKRVGLLAVFLSGMSYWINVQARVALRFILYPAFVAPVLYYLVRGIRLRARNDFILAGVFLGIGLHGYTPIRALPIAVAAAVLLYILHKQSHGNRRQALVHLALLALVSFIVFIPLARFALEDPAAFNYRTLTRMSSLERELPGPAIGLFFSNLWNALKMFNWSAGNIWPVSIPLRPALDIVSAALFVLGAALLFVRYLQKRHWQDLFLLVAVPVLMLPSILVLAFPDENPAPNRASGAAVVVFIIVALALEGFLAAVIERLGTRRGRAVATALGALLIAMAGLNNYNLVFEQYNAQYQGRSWNTTEMGRVMRTYIEAGVPAEQAWVLAFPHWVDTRLVGFASGQPGRDTAISPEQAAEMAGLPGAKLFLVKYDDQDGLARLRELYPQASYSLYESEVPFKEFYIFLVPAGQ